MSFSAFSPSLPNPTFTYSYAYTYNHHHLQMTSTGQQGAASWLDEGFAYGSDSLGHPCDAWGRLCALWLPREEGLSRGCASLSAAAAAAAAGDGTAAKASAEENVVWCGGVYDEPGGVASNILSAAEASTRWCVSCLLACAFLSFVFVSITPCNTH